MLGCSTENVSKDSNFEKPTLTSEGEKYSVLREGILSRKKLISGSWLPSEKLLLFEKILKLIDSKFGSEAILIQLNLNVAFQLVISIYFAKLPPFFNYNSSVAKLSHSNLIMMCFYFFPRLFTQLHRFSTKIFVYK